MLKFPQTIWGPCQKELRTILSLVSGTEVNSKSYLGVCVTLCGTGPRQVWKLVLLGPNWALLVLKNFGKGARHPHRLIAGSFVRLCLHIFILKRFLNHKDLQLSVQLILCTSYEFLPKHFTIKSFYRFYRANASPVDEDGRLKTSSYLHFGHFLS